MSQCLRTLIIIGGIHDMRARRWRHMFKHESWHGMLYNCGKHVDL